MASLHISLSRPSLLHILSQQGICANSVTGVVLCFSMHLGMNCDLKAIGKYFVRWKSQLISSKLSTGDSEITYFIKIFQSYKKNLHCNTKTKKCCWFFVVTQKCFREKKNICPDL